jgi:tetratricopeptide (TPR) repeat protein
MPVSRNPLPLPVAPTRARRWLGVWVVVMAGFWANAGAVELAEVRKEFFAGNYADAVKLATEVVADVPGDEEGHLLKIEALLTVGRVDEADRALTDALGRLPQSLRLHWLGRQVAFAGGQPEAAAKHLDAIKDLYANRPYAYRNPADLVVFGEIGLAGEIRPVQNGPERLREAAKHGFKKAIVPKANVSRESGMELIPVARLEEALAAI